MLKEGWHVTFSVSCHNYFENSATSFLRIATAFSCLVLAFHLKRGQIILGLLLYLSMVNYDLQKSLTCCPCWLKMTGNPPDSFDVIVFDGGALIHLLSTVNIITFNQYAVQIPQAAGKIHSCRCCLGYLYH